MIRARLLLLAALGLPGASGPLAAQSAGRSAPASGAAPAAAPARSDDAARLFNQGLALWRGGQPDGAMAALRRSRAALPYESAFALGVIAARQGDLEAAAGEFARALRAREGDAEALANLRWVLHQLERLPGARGSGAAARRAVAMTAEEARRLIDTLGQPRRRLAPRAEEGRW